MTTQPKGITVLLPARRPNPRMLLSALRSTFAALSREDKLFLLSDPRDPQVSQAISPLFGDRLRLIPVDEDMPLAAKLNVGLEQVETQFVARMDSDDICLPWRFKRQLYLAERFDSVVLSTAVIFGKDLRPLPILPQLPISLKPEEFVEALFFGNPGIHPTLLLKTDSLRTVHGYRSVPGEDLDLWLRLAIAKIPILRDGMPSILYRYSKHSMSHGLENDLGDAAETSANQIRGALPAFGPVEPEKLESVRSQLLKQRKVSWKTRAMLLSLGLNK